MAFGAFNRKEKEMNKTLLKLLWFGAILQLIGGIILIYKLGWVTTLGIGILLWGYSIDNEIKTKFKSK